MKTMKRVAALVLCLSLLIGIPCAVQAVDVPSDGVNGMQLLNAFAMSTRFVKNYNDDGLADTCVVLYFNDNTNDAYDIRDNKYVSMYIEPYNTETSYGLQPATFHAVDYYGNTAGSGKKVVVIKFEDASQKFSSWKNQGATDFRFYMVDNKGTTVDGYVDGWASTKSYGWKLRANNTYDGKDAVITEILFEADTLQLVNYCQVNSSKILVQFSEPVEMAPLAVDNGPVKIELHATLGSLNGNKQPGDSSGAIADAVKKTWEAKSFTILGNSNYVEVEFDKNAVSEAVAWAAANECTLNLFVSENSSATKPTAWGKSGEQTDNGLIDGIWAASNNCPLLAWTGKHRDDVANDTAYIWITQARPVAWGVNGVYNNLNDALNAGGAITLAQGLEIEERFLEIPSGVTLDLNGCVVEVANIFSFGNIIDSTDGKGGLVISNDKTQAFVGLQESNTYFPLYDNDRYRFFSYDVISAGTKADTNSVKFGVKVVFNNLKAYELLKADGELVLDLMIGEKNIPYRFNKNTMTSLYDTVSGDWNNRSSYAITLNIYGLEVLESGAVITAAPTLTSAGVVGNDATIEYTYTSAE